MWKRNVMFLAMIEHTFPHFMEPVVALFVRMLTRSHFSCNPSQKRVFTTKFVVTKMGNGRSHDSCHHQGSFFRSDGIDKRNVGRISLVDSFASWL